MAEEVIPKALGCETDVPCGAVGVALLVLMSNGGVEEAATV